MVHIDCEVSSNMYTSCGGPAFHDWPKQLGGLTMAYRHHPTRRGFIGLAALGFSAVSLSRLARAASSLERAKQDGFIRVGFANEAPFGFATPEGKLTGEAPEVVKAVLNAMGIPQVDGVLTEFGSLIPGLKAKRFDIIAAGMFITPKRCAESAFSEPSYGIGQAMLVKAGNPKQHADYGSIVAKSHEH